MRAAVLAGLVVALGMMPAWAADQRTETLRQYGVELANRDRVAAGLPPFRPDAVLAQAAQAHAEDMLARNYFSHVSPEGGSVRQRFDQAGGGRWRTLAENISHCTECPDSYAPSRIEETQQGWMDSPGHRANLLSPDLDAIGYGLAIDGDRSYAVQVFSGQ